MKKVYILLLLWMYMTNSLFARESINYESYRTSGGISYVKLSDGFTNYELTGPSDAEHTVILIHGGTIPLCIWDPQMDTLLKAGFRVLRYDQYGRGFSSRPQVIHGRELFCRQLKELLDSLNIAEPVDIIGPSFGGAISVTFASKFPSRVRSLLLISPALNVIGSDSPLAGPFKILRNKVLGTPLYKLLIKRKLIKRALVMLPGANEAPCAATFTNQFKCIGTDRSLLSLFRSDAFGDYHIETKVTGSTINKILLLRGENDKEITPKMVETVRSELPNCKFIELKNSGHSPGTTSTQIMNGIIVDFIASH
jgi:pimeloyl-ACP methyl ester carboxylesterase